MNDTKQLILVDGSSYLYRAFHAMPSLGTHNGQPTGAIYGIVNMLRRLLKEYQPERMAVVFDAPGRTFRNELYAEYKATRPPMPPELRSQVAETHTVLEAMGLPLLTVDKVEADDVIGTLALREAAAGNPVLILSGDKDLTQLVNERIGMMDGMRDMMYDREGVIRKFGVPPERIVDYLALIGDSSDNVPGVPKVGPKTAIKWLTQYGTLDNLIEHAADLSGKIGENLRDSLDWLPRARQLVTIKTDVDLGTRGEAALNVRPPDAGALRICFTRLEFKSWLAELDAAEPETAASAAAPENAPGADYETITSEEALQRWITQLRQSPLFALHSCTASATDSPHEGELVGIAFSGKEGKGAYLPLAHDYPGAPRQVPRDRALDLLKPLLSDPKACKAGHNIKDDAILLERCGVALQGIRFDTMLESYVLDSTGSRHDRERLWVKYLGQAQTPPTRQRGKPPFHQLPLETAAPQAAAAAERCLRLHQALWPRLQQSEPQRRIFEQLEMPLVPVLAQMEANCVGIDGEMLRRQDEDLGRRAREVEQRAHEAAGGPFNIASPREVQTVLYDKLQLRVLRKTPGGQRSTAEAVLEELAAEYELPRLILKYRSLSKLQSTYTDKLPKRINPRTGRIHTCYHQAVAATGRLSSSDPNLQNIPVRSADGRRIREAFVPDPGHLLLSADYSQIELRIMAHLSADDGLLAAFRRGEDIHRCTAAEVFGLAPEAVIDDQRRHAKAINFGLIYGMSAFGLARQLHIGQDQARLYIQQYFSRYPGVKAYMESTRQKARQQGYVETVFGRRLYLPEIKAPSHSRRQYAERAAINAPMQGTAADLIKRAMIEVHNWIRREAPSVRMIMQVHDELVFEIPTEEIEHASREIIARMSSVGPELSVPLEVKAGTGSNWAQAHC